VFVTHLRHPRHGVAHREAVDGLAGIRGLADDQAVVVGRESQGVREARGRLEVDGDALPRGVLSPEHGTEEGDPTGQVGVADRGASAPEGAGVAAEEAGEGGQGLDGVPVVRPGPERGLLVRPGPRHLTDDVAVVVDGLGTADGEAGHGADVRGRLGEGGVGEHAHASGGERRSGERSGHESSSDCPGREPDSGRRRRRRPDEYTAFAGYCSSFFVRSQDGAYPPAHAFS
jgi:hypothetical protein